MPERTSPIGIPKPTKADRVGIKRRKEIKQKDREWQSEVPREGNCFNCGFWKPLVGDHAIKRRYFATRHDPSKGISDALNGIAWKDDSQVYWSNVKKEHGENPRAEVTVSYDE